MDRQRLLLREPHARLGPGRRGGQPDLRRRRSERLRPRADRHRHQPRGRQLPRRRALLCDRSLGRDPAPGQGPTEATINVYCDGALLATYPRIRLDETDDWVNVARVDYPGCVGRSINTRSNGTSLLPASFTSARHCEISCSADSDCPTGERCATVGGGGPPRRACVLNR